MSIMYGGSSAHKIRSKATAESHRSARGGGAKTCRDRRFIVSDEETVLGTFYTIDTVRALRAAYPQVSFIWLIGRRQSGWPASLERLA